MDKKSILGVSTLFLLGIVLLEGGGVPAICPPKSGCIKKKEICATATFEVDYYGMFRDQIHEVELLYFDKPNGDLGVVAKDFNHISLPYVTGLRALAEFTPNANYTVQFIYTGLFHWSASEKETDQTSHLGVSTLPFTTVDWNAFQILRYNYKSNFNSYDMALWYNVTPRFNDYFSFSMIFSGRQITLKDSIMLTGTNSPNKNHSFTKMSNLLYGGQFGLDFEWSPTRRITWELQAKLGLYSNYITKVFWIDDLNDTVRSGSVNATVNRLSYSADFLPSVFLQLDPLYFRFGYEAFFLYKLGIAPLQFGKDRSQLAVEMDNHIFMQGLIIGAGWVF